jgi:hypothetical protein
MGFHVFETMEDGRVKMTMVTQTDDNIKGSALIGYKALAPTLIPKQLKEWH